MHKITFTILSFLTLAVTGLSLARAEVIYVEKDFPEAAGKNITFCGEIVQTIKKKLPYSGEVIFLNFERPYPSTIVSISIPHNAIKNFKNYRSYKGRRVCVRGVFHEYEREDHKGYIYDIMISSPSNIN